MALYQVAYTIKKYVTKIVEADTPQESWTKIKEGRDRVATIIQIGEQVDSLVSIDKISETRVDLNSLTL